MNGDFFTSSGDPREMLQNTIRELSQAKEYYHALAGKCQEAEFLIGSALDYVGHQYRLLDQGAPVSGEYYSSAAATTMSGTAFCAQSLGIHGDMSEQLVLLNQKARDLQSSTYANYRTLTIGQPTAEDEVVVPAPESDFDPKHLIAKIKRIAPGIAPKIEGCFAALDSDNPDNFSQAYHSMREAFGHLMEVLAPDDQVRKASWFVADKSSNSGVTRAQRFKYAILGFKASTDVPDPPTTELVRHTLVQYNTIIGGDHKLSHNSAESVRADLVLFAEALNRFLEVRETNLRK